MNVPTDQYGADHPDLAGLIEQLTEMLEAGESVNLEPLLKEHPQHAEQIQSLFPAMTALMDLATSATRNEDVLASDSSHGASEHRRLGDFRIGREIGRGGMGIVYEAEQISMRRRVALKVLPLAGLVDDLKIRRFQNEVRAVAALDHPNIVSVYMVGEERGVHYYAMQLIRGPSLSEAISSLRHERDEGAGLDASSMSQIARMGRVDDRAEVDGVAAADRDASAELVEGDLHRDARPERVETVAQADSSTIPHSSRREYFRSVTALGIQAATALQHAHDQGIIHRDIKPSNLLLDSSSKLYLTDFGLARIESDVGVTMTGDLIGTLRYMAPEQALAKRVVVDHRADIYSLAATLYELLTLRPAYLAEDRQQLLKQIAFEEPTPLRHIDRNIPAELETIVHKAMSKDMGQRYSSAQELADDLQSHADNRPIQAKPPTLSQRIGKWTRRNPILTWASIITLSLITMTLAASTRLIANQRDIAIQAEQKTRDQLYVSDVNRAQAAHRAGDIELTLRLLRRHSPDLRRFEWFYLWGICHQGLATPPLYHPGGIVGHGGAAFSPDGLTVATGCSDGAIRLWDTNTGVRKREWPFEAGDRWTETLSVEFSPDGRTLAAQRPTHWSPRRPGRLVLYDVRTGHRRELQSKHLAAAFVDENTLLTVREDGTLRWWNIHTGEQQEVRSLDLAGGTWSLVAFSPDGKTIAASHSNEPLVTLWDIETSAKTGALQLKLEQANTWELKFSPDGQILAEISAGGPLWSGGRLNLWDVATQGVRHTIREPVRGLFSMAFLPAGVVATGGAGDIKFWDLDADEADESMETLRAHTGVVFCLSTSADRRVMASTGFDGYVRLWHVQREQNPQVVKAHESVDALAYSPTGEYLASSGDGEVKLWNPDAGVVLHTFPGGRLGSVAFSRGDRTLATASRSDPTIRLWDVQTKNEEGTIKGHTAGVKSVAFSPDGKRLVSASSKEVMISDVRSGRQLDVLQTAGAACVAFSPVANLVAFNDGRVIKLRDLDSGRELSLVGHKDGIGDMVFSPDGQRLASASGRYEMILWDTETGHPVETIAQKGVAVVLSVDFVPDGRSLLTADWLGAVRLWDLVTGEQRFTLREYGGPPASSAVFSPDSRTVVAGFRDGTVVFWRASPLEK